MISAREMESSHSVTKRRKVRRGTSSCWECKRRKIRCCFEPGESGPCTSCRHRGSKCVLQHHLGDPSASDVESRYGLGQKIVHVESLVSQLIRGLKRPQLEHASQEDNMPPWPADDASHAVVKESQSSHSARGRPLLPRPTPKPTDRVAAKSSTLYAPRALGTDRSLGQSLEALRDRPFLMRGPPGPHPLTLLIQSFLPPAHAEAQIMHRGKLFSLCMLMLRKPIKIIVQSPSIQDISRTITCPLTDNRPIFAARKLIQLAICLQTSQNLTNANELTLDGSLQDVASHYVEAASQYVTSQDALVASLEGLETLLFEGTYHMARGHLRPAWLVFRRALGIAQLMGLNMPQLRQQREHGEADTLLTNISPEYLWFRLISMERSVALQLGLPSSVSDDGFAAEEFLVGGEPYETLERNQAMLAGRILNRNECMRRGTQKGEAAYHHYQETQSIDYKLRQAARALPTKWWALPRLKGSPTEMGVREETAKILIQQNYFHLLLFLHLPYVIPRRSITQVTGGTAAADYTYSKFSALTASRELLARLSVSPGPPDVPSLSQGSCVKVFLSALTLLLAHLDSHRLGRNNVLEHQRPQDLDIAQRCFDGLDLRAVEQNDISCRPRAQVLRKLIDVEAAAADGAAYTVWSEDNTVEDVNCITITDVGPILELRVPCFGFVRIVREEESEAAPVGNGLLALDPAEEIESHLAIAGPETNRQSGRTAGPAMNTLQSWSEASSCSWSMLANTYFAANSDVEDSFIWPLAAGSQDAVESLGGSCELEVDVDQQLYMPLPMSVYQDGEIGELDTTI